MMPNEKNTLVTQKVKVVAISCMPGSEVQVNVYISRRIPITTNTMIKQNHSGSVYLCQDEIGLDYKSVSGVRIRRGTFLSTDTYIYYQIFPVQTDFILYVSRSKFNTVRIITAVL